MHRGYVKFWRKALDSGLIQKPELWCFWCWCLLKASHKPLKQLVGFQAVDLQPGQFVFGRKKASAELGLSERKIRTCLKSLENMQNLTIKTTNKFSIISIVNWSIYQGCETENDQLIDQQATNKRPASDHKQECIKNEKNNQKTCSPEMNAIGFTEFWSAFPPRGFPPRKTGREKAYSAWKSLTSKKELPEITFLLSCLERDRGSSQWMNPKFIPMASTWLNSKPWLDMEENESETLYDLGLRMLKEKVGGT